MFKSCGILRYSKNPYKLILEIDKSISDYYRSLIPKWISFNKQKFAPHISVVRNELTAAPYAWGKYNGAVCEFEYEGYVYEDETYLWLSAWSKKLEEIRLELGLANVSHVTRSPDGRHKFHITIGNFKHDLQKDNC